MTFEEAVEYVRKVAGDTFADHVRDFARDPDCLRSVSITKDTSCAENTLRRQDEPGDAFGYIMLWQKCGHCGDDYYGQFFIPLPNGEWVKCDYGE